MSDTARSSTTLIRRMHRRIVLLVACGILLTSLLAGLAAVLPYYFSSRAHLEDVTRMTIRAQAQALHHQLSRYQDAVRQFVSRTEIRRQLASFVRSEISLDALQGYTTPRLADAVGQMPDVVGLVRQDMAGTDLIRLGRVPDQPIPGSNHTPGYPCRFLMLEDGTLLLQACAPIHDDQGVQIGRDLVFFSADSLLALLRLDQRLSAGSIAWFSDSHGQYVMASGSGQLTLGHADIRAALDTLHNDQLLQFDAPVGDAGWRLHLAVPADQLHQQSLQLLLWPAVTVLLLALGGTLLVHRLIRPMLRIALNQARALEQSEQQQRQAASVFRHASEAILITDAQHAIVEANPTFCRLTGYEAGALVSRSIAELLAQREYLQERVQAVLEKLDEQDAWQGEVHYRCADGATLIALQTISAVHDADGQLIRYIHIFNDVTDKKREEEQVRHQALHDELTGLPNRASLEHHLQLKLKRGRHGDSGQFALLFLDLDRFKQVNDRLGHKAGDLLLQQVGQRLTGSLRQGDLLARLGGDEFILVLDPLRDPEDAAKVAAHIRAALTAPFQLYGQHAQIGVSIGIALYPEHGSTAQELLEAADTAMYAAKNAGRNTWRFASQTHTSLP